MMIISQNGRIKSITIYLLALYINILGLSPELSFAAKRAFVFGINNYENVPKLPSPILDAASVAETLKTLGYEITLLPESKTSRTLLLINWGKFVQSLSKGDDVVVYYSGHGVGLDGDNFIVPKDTPGLSDVDNAKILKPLLVSVSTLMDDVNQKPVNASIWILDSCRDNPFANPQGKSLPGTNGFANLESPSGTFIFYAAGFGETALDLTISDDGITPKNSLYTRVLLQAMKSQADVPVNLLATSIRSQVRSLAVPHIQRPAYYDGLTDPWCFKQCKPTETAFKSILIDGSLTELIAGANINSALLAASVKNAGTPSSLPNVVFLGKLSALPTCAENSNAVSERFPFGCQILKAASEGQSASIVGQSLKPLTEVNVRKSVPELSGDKLVDAFGPIEPCVVNTLNSNSTIKLSSVVNLVYSGDTYYWGAIEGPSLDCRRTK